MLRSGGVRPVPFEIAERTRVVVLEWIKRGDRKPGAECAVVSVPRPGTGCPPEACPIAADREYGDEKPWLTQ
jgi:hypothetical protein